MAASRPPNHGLNSVSKDAYFLLCLTPAGPGVLGAGPERGRASAAAGQR